MVMNWNVFILFNFFQILQDHEKIVKNTLNFSKILENTE